MGDEAVYRSTSTDDKTDQGAIGIAFKGAGVNPEDYQATGARVAAVARRMADWAKSKLLSQEDINAELARKREESLAKKQENREALEALLDLDEGTKKVYLIALQDKYILSSRRVLSPKEQEALRVAEELIEGLRSWPPAARLPLMEGMPNAENPDLRKGFNAWRKEQEEAAEAARQERGNAENVLRRELRDLATCLTLHEAMRGGNGDIAIVYVHRHYTQMRYDEGTHKMVVVTQLVKGKPEPVMRRGTFLLTITGDGKYGQILHHTVNMPFVKEVPCPTQPVVLRPEHDFASPGGEPYFHSAVQEMLCAQWRQEELRETDTTIAGLMETGTGRAMGYVPHMEYSGRAGSIRVWLEGRDGRLYLLDCEIHALHNRDAFNLSGFPKEGIPLKPAANEPSTLRFMRVMLSNMVQEEEVVSAYERMAQAHPSTVEDVGALLDATSKQTITSRIRKWHRGDKSATVVISVENTGRGKADRKIRVVGYFTRETRFAIREGTEVPASLKLIEEASDEQKMLVSMLRYLSGRKAAPKVQPEPPSGEDATKAPEREEEVTREEVTVEA